MKKLLTTDRIFHIGTLCLLILLVLFSFRHYLFHTYTNNAFVRFDIYPVNSQVASEIEKVLVKDNQFVEKGEPLILLDKEDYKQHMVAAQAGIDYYEFLLNSEKKLYTKNAVSHKSYLETLKDYKSSQALYQHYKIQLEMHSILAPHSGIVTNMDLENGTYVNIGQPLFTIIDKTSAYIQANFLESNIKNIKVGDKAKIILSTLKETYLGSVIAISSGIAITGLKTASGLQAPIEDYNWFPIPRRVPIYIKIDYTTP